MNSLAFRLFDERSGSIHELRHPELTWSAHLESIGDGRSSVARSVSSPWRCWHERWRLSCAHSRSQEISLFWKAAQRSSGSFVGLFSRRPNLLVQKSWMMPTPRSPILFKTWAVIFVGAWCPLAPHPPRLALHFPFENFCRSTWNNLMQCLH